MKYRLKDKELQRKLDEISGGDFSKRLNDTADVWANNPDIVSIAWETGLGKQRLFKVWIPRSDIEEIPQYDPHRWNRFPEVTPPQGAMMRIKYHDVTSEDRKVERGFAIFDCGQWVNDSGYPKFPNNPQNYVVWFRPWIGPNEEGKE